MLEQRSKAITSHQVINDLVLREKTIEKQQQNLQTRLKNGYPDYYALKYPKPVDLKMLQKQVLQPNELMLVYGVMENRTVLWMIGKDTFQVFDLPLSEKTLTEKVKDIRLGVDWRLDTRTFERSDIEKPLSDKKLSEITYELYNQLFPYPVRPLVEKADTVYIVPTSVLYALPFEMLVTKPVKRETDTIHYLIEKAPISYLSSASLLKILRDAKKRRVKTARYPLLAFANPNYESSGFSPLPNTASEAKEIAKFFKLSTLQLGEQASVEKVFEFNKKERLDDYKYLLFATHGVIPGESNVINQPALVLSHPNLKKEEGLLTMANVFDLQLNAKLVSLSACNTGRGEQERGEGVMGLTRAFMYAGTPTVAVTLWEVNTYSTEQLNVDFFEQLSKGKKPAKALQTVKLKMLSGDNEKYRHPYY